MALTSEHSSADAPLGWRTLVGLAVLYYLTGAIGLTSLLQSSTTAPVVPTAGVALAMILLAPQGSRWRVLVTLWIADFAVERTFGAQSLPVHLGITTIVVGEALAGALVMEMLGGRDAWRLARLRDIGALVGGALVGTLLGSAVGAVLVMAISDAGYWSAFLEWSVPDFVAYVTITPAILAMRRAFAERTTPRLMAVLEFALLAGLTAAGTWYANVGWRIVDGPQVPFSVVVLPLLGWAALRFGTLGTGTTTLFIGGISVVQTLRGVSSFTGLSPDPFLQLVWNQVFIVTVSISMLALAAALAEREESAAAQERASEDARRTAARFQAFFEGTPEMIAVVDRDERLVMATAAWCAEQARRSGKEPVLGLPLPALHRADDKVEGAGDSGWSDALAGRPVVVARRTMHADGREREYEHQFAPLRDAHGEIIGATESVRDVDALRGRQADAARAQRLESIGRLAGGVAHDFNNVLSAIVGFASLVEASLDDGDERRADLAQITAASRRASGLTAQLLAYASQQPVEPRIVEPAPLIEALAPMLRRLIGDDIALELRTPPDTWAVFADPGQLEQVVVNLIVNARDAMLEGGRVIVSTTNETSPRAEGASAPPAESVRITVSDTGRGIPEELRSRIFEPFFTTKGSGRGSGLGLATVEGIVRQAGGTIAVHSEMGSGTTFTILLPRALDAVPMPSEAPAAATLTRGTGRLLLVEDDDALRTLCMRVLRGQGYEVIDAGDAESALALSASDLASATLLVTDVVLPGMNGPTLATELVARYPALRVLYMSGYAEDALMQRGLAPEGTQLLAKPFTPRALLAKVEAMLAVATPPSVK